MIIICLVNFIKETDPMRNVGLHATEHCLVWFGHSALTLLSPSRHRTEFPSRIYVVDHVFHVESTSATCIPRGYSVPCHLYADDTVLLSNNADGLQYTLNCLARYCEHWKLQVNTSKIGIVIFSKEKSKKSYNFTFNNNKVNTVDSFKYLGVYFNYNVSFIYHKKFIFGQAQKALFALLKKSKELELPVDIQLELFDYLVLPILTYGCEIWGYENISRLDKLHLQFPKYILCVKQSTPTCMVLGETGRFPLSIAIKTRMIYFSVQPNNE